MWRVFFLIQNLRSEYALSMISLDFRKFNKVFLFFLHRNKMTFEIGFKFEIESFEKNNQIECSLESRQEFEIISILGQGSFGKVFQVKNLPSSDKYFFAYLTMLNYLLISR